MSTQVTAAPVSMSFNCRASPAADRAETASICRTCPNVTIRRKVPNVAGGRAPMEQAICPAVPQHRQVRDRIDAGYHARDQRRHLQPGRVARTAGDCHMSIGQLGQPSCSRQTHRSDQPGMRDQVGSLNTIDRTGPTR